MEGFVLEGSAEERGVSGAVCLDGLAKTGVLGGREVWVVLSWSIHDLQGGGGHKLCITVKGGHSDLKTAQTLRFENIDGCIDETSDAES